MFFIQNYFRSAGGIVHKKGIIEVNFWHHTVRLRSVTFIEGTGSYHFVNGKNQVNLILLV